MMVMSDPSPNEIPGLRIVKFCSKSSNRLRFRLAFRSVTVNRYKLCGTFQVIYESSLSMCDFGTAEDSGTGNAISIFG